MESRSIWSQERYITAYRFAAQAHHGQTVPGTDGLPYLLHLGMVAMEVMGALQFERFQSPDLAMQCALLHDSLEDTETSYQAVVDQFGAAVADGVRALSKDSALPKEQRMADSLRRIRQQPREVWIVKLGDRITNLQEPPSYWTVTKRTSYRDEAIQILDSLGAASSYLSERMQKKIDAYQHYLDA